MVTNKRGQFFLLAAVIIAAVIISLGVNPNRATVSREPESFYDFSYEVKRETGAVIDYEVYSFDDDANLTEFVDLLAGDIRDMNPEANFLFIYGNDTSINLRNYGHDDAVIDDEDVLLGSGASAISKICYGGSCENVSTVISDYDGDVGRRHLNSSVLAGSGGEISVKVRGYEFGFSISEHRQVIFIMQKDVDDESFVTAR